MTKELAPLDTIGVAAKLEDRGLSIGVRSRFATAVDRLLGGYVDVLLAHAEGLEARIRARDDERLRSKSLVNSVDKTAAEIVEHRVLLEHARRQDNLDAVVAEAIDNLSGDNPEAPTKDEAVELDADWLNLFSDYASKASSERMRELWGGILSGEIRRPGGFSLVTLQALSTMDKATAQKFEAVLSKVFGGDSIVVTTEMWGDVYTDLLHLQARGLIHFTPTSVTRCDIKDDGFGWLSCGREAIRFAGSAGTKINIPSAFLSIIGVELSALVKVNVPRSTAEMVARVAPKTNLTDIGAYAPDKKTLIAPLWNGND